MKFDFSSINESFLEKLDYSLFHFLASSVDIMPLRFKKLIASAYPDARIRKLYFNRLGVFMGEGTYANLGMKAIVSEGEKHQIQIGKNVSIGPNLTLVCESSANNGTLINEIPYVKEVLTVNLPIHIDDEVWIGANVVILPGVTIGKCSVIGAGSVVTMDVAPFSVYAGVPARKIRDLNTVQRSEADDPNTTPGE